MNYRNLCMGLLLMLAAIPTKLLAGAPDWQVTPSQYLYSSTITAVLDYDGIKSNDDQDRVAAFINGEVRGVAAPAVDVDGQKLVYLTVYSNVAEGEEVSFRLYRASEDKVYEAVTRLSFTNNASFGEPDQPFVISTNTPPLSISLSPASLAENEPANKLIGTLTTQDADAQDVNFTYSLVEGDGGEDNASFTIAGDKLMANPVFNYEEKHLYSVRLQADDGRGGTISQPFSIQVEDKNDAPQLADATFELEETQVAGTLLGVLQANDEDAGQSLSFSLIFEGSGNAPFTIEPETGRILIQNPDALDFEKTPRLEFKAVVNDNGDPSLSATATVVVELQDTPEAELPANNYISPNGDGRNDRWIVDKLPLFEGYTFSIYSRGGKQVFHTDRYANDWHGITADGKELPSGVYYYVVENKSKNKLYRGTLTLVR